MSSKKSYSLCIALLAARVVLVLWPNYGLVVDSLRTGPRTVLCPGCGTLLWLVMVECVAWLQVVCGLSRDHCVDYFVGISYATVRLEDQSCHCLSLNSMLSGNCLIKCWYMSSNIYIEVGMSFIWKLYACDLIV